MYVYISDSFTCSVLTAKGLCCCFHVPVGYESASVMPEMVLEC